MPVALEAFSRRSIRRSVGLKKLVLNLIIIFQIREMGNLKNVLKPIQTSNNKFLTAPQIFIYFSGHIYRKLSFSAPEAQF